MAAGYAWRFFNPGGLDRHRVRHAMNMAVLHFFLPPLAFGLIAAAPLDRSFIAVPMTAAAVTVLAIAAAFAAYKLPWLNRADRPAVGVMIMAAAFGNVTYLGLPVINEVLGPRYGYAAILYDLLASTPIVFTLGVFIAARHGGGPSPSFSNSLKRILKLPPVWAVAAGLAVNLGGMPVPRIVLDTAALMGKAVIPVMTFTVGLALDFRDVKRIPEAVPALALKLIVSPILAKWIGVRVGMRGPVLTAAVIEAAMPVMVLSLVIADEFDLDVPLAAACIAASSVALFFTMPMMMKLLL